MLGGGIALGPSGIQAAPQPDMGVSLLVNLDQVDVDRWEAWLSTLSASTQPQASTSAATSSGARGTGTG